MPTRKTMNISLPSALKTWIDRQVASGGYGTASEYLRHLIRQARATEIDEIDQRLIASEKSGKPFRPSAQDWAELARRGDRRAAELRRSIARTRRRSA